MLLLFYHFFLTSRSRSCRERRLRVQGGKSHMPWLGGMSLITNTYYRTAPPPRFIIRRIISPPSRRSRSRTYLLLLRCLKPGFRKWMGSCLELFFFFPDRLGPPVIGYSSAGLDLPYIHTSDKQMLFFLPQFFCGKCQRWLALPLL